MNPHRPDDFAFLIPAAGGGVRLGSGAKALLELDGHPLLHWVVEKARRVATEVIVAVPADDCAIYAERFPDCRCIPGGATRQDSVARLARASTRPWLLLHDVARPFASLGLLLEVARAARVNGCAAAVLDPEVPVARVHNGKVVSCHDRHEAGVFQSPQAFARERLLELIARSEREGWQTQSTLQLALLTGCRIDAVPGEKTNIKLTTEHDWAIAQILKDHLR